METIQTLLFFIFVFLGIYQLAIWFLSFFYKEKYITTPCKQHRFMAIIPARNEEKVIQNLINSLKQQNYPAELLDIYVIADNCTDKTALLAKEAGAIVYERFNTIRKNKGFALEWFFNVVLNEYPDKYDAFCIFDADNIVASDFFYIMNSKLCNR